MHTLLYSYIKVSIFFIALNASLCYASFHSCMHWSIDNSTPVFRSVQKATWLQMWHFFGLCARDDNLFSYVSYWPMSLELKWRESLKFMIIIETGITEKSSKWTYSILQWQLSRSGLPLLLIDLFSVVSKGSHVEISQLVKKKKKKWPGFFLLCPKWKKNKNIDFIYILTMFLTGCWHLTKPSWT